MFSRPLAVLVVLAVLLLVMATGSYYIIERAEQSRSQIPVFGEVIPFQFVSAGGQPFGLKQLKGKISVVDFIFTRCLGPCPVMGGHMSELYEMYDGSDLVQLVSISVDPAYDTPEVLADYALGFGVDDRRWVFLCGSADSVKVLCESGFKLNGEDLPAAHSTRFVLVDPTGTIRGYYRGLDDDVIKTIADDINQLARSLP